MITVIIIDDEINSREYLQNLIERFFSTQLHVFDVAENLTRGVELIRSFKPDIVFLDIEMPEANGFKLFDHFNGEEQFRVVFTTAYKDYAINAIKNNAFDYLLKPVDKMDILDVIRKFEREQQGKQKQNTEVLGFKHENMPKIALATLYGIKYIEHHLFLYARAEGSYSEIHTIDGQAYTISKSLKEFEEMTSHLNYFRSHKSYLVNLAHVSELIKKDEFMIVLKNNTKIPLSIRRKDEFLSKIT